MSRVVTSSLNQKYSSVQFGKILISSFATPVVEIVNAKIIRAIIMISLLECGALYLPKDIEVSYSDIFLLESGR